MQRKRFRKKSVGLKASQQVECLQTLDNLLAPVKRLQLP